jgi:hypothetical protein
MGPASRSRPPESSRLSRGRWLGNATRSAMSRTLPLAFIAHAGPHHRALARHARGQGGSCEDQREAARQASALRQVGRSRRFWGCRVGCRIGQVPGSRARGVRACRAPRAAASTIGGSSHLAARCARAHGVRGDWLRGWGVHESGRDDGASRDLRPWWNDGARRFDRTGCDRTRLLISLRQQSERPARAGRRLDTAAMAPDQRASGGSAGQRARRRRARDASACPSVSEPAQAATPRDGRSGFER